LSIMSDSFIAIPSYIYIYQGAEADHLNIAEIVDYLKTILRQAEIYIRAEFFSFYLSSYSSEKRDKILNEIAFQMTKLKIRDLTRKEILSKPLQVEIDYERRNLSRSINKTFGVIYEGFNLQQLYLSIIPEKERDLKHLHLIFTNQLFATWEQKNRRYHARVSIYGFPSLISTSGIVEAPAKPRDFYLKRQMGEDIHRLKKEYKEFFIDYNDPRLTDVLKGYVTQALFYQIVGYPFCDDEGCRLFNAHRQNELLHAQLLSPYEFCPKHQAMLDQLKEV